MTTLIKANPCRQQARLGSSASRETLHWDTTVTENEGTGMSTEKLGLKHLGFPKLV